jgi:hypothetical protein
MKIFKRKRCEICKKKIKKKMLTNKSPLFYYHENCWIFRKKMMIRDVIRQRKYDRYGL